MKAVALILASFVPGVCFGALFDLQADWSNVNNPNGQWTLEKNLNMLFTTVQGDFFGDGSNQIAWADDPYPVQAHVPVWFKATAPTSLDYQLGDIVMHGSVSWRTGSTQTSAIWTSTIDGVASMTGHTWLVRNIGRQMDWGLFKNGALLTSGHMVGGDGYTRANPFDFSAGTGGAAALTQPIAVGDRLELRYMSLDDVPDMAGVDFRVDAVPEPASVAFVLVGLSGLAARRRQRLS